MGLYSSFHGTLFPVFVASCLLYACGKKRNLRGSCPKQSCLTLTCFIFYLGVHYLGHYDADYWYSYPRVINAISPVQAAQLGPLPEARQQTVAGHSSSLLVLELGGVRRALAEGRPSYLPGNLLTRPSLAMRAMASLSVRLGTASAIASR